MSLRLMVFPFSYYLASPLGQRVVYAHERSPKLLRTHKKFLEASYVNVWCRNLEKGEKGEAPLILLLSFFFHF